jgi:dTDP-4-amino-4,6-dideoxygalactose transaminase
MTEYQTASPHFPGKEWILEQIEKKLDGEGILTMGSQVSRFEDEFASYVNRDHGIATNSCTSALEATLRAIDISNQEVIVPAQTFIATGSAVVSAGGRPVFAEINPENYCLSMEGVRRQITAETAAVILVHFGGLVPSYVDELRDLCDQNDICLIEDAAHAHGAKRDGKPAGSFGHVGCFSFYATKNMTTGEGGMVVTDDDKLAKRASSIRNRGIDTDADKELYSNIGSNYRMSELAGILGRSQLEHLDNFVDHRNKIARVYNRKLTELTESNSITYIDGKGDTRHAHWRYTIKLQRGINRIAIRNAVKKAGIDIDWAYDPPLHLQPVFKRLYDTHQGLLPTSEEAMSQHICLPIHVGISEDDATYIAEKVSKELNKQQISA